MNETVSNIKKKEIISDSNISIHEDTKKTKQTASIASPTTIDNESNSIFHSSISQELIKLTFPESNNLLDDDMNNLGDTDTFGQIKNDFNLLYTDEYITMIPDDLLKLVLQLLIEKMFEIVNCYHTQMSNEKIIYNKVNDLYKECSHKFLLLNKQYNLLQHKKEKFQISKQNINFITGNYSKTSNHLLSINKDEIKMFSLLMKKAKTK